MRISLPLALSLGLATFACNNGAIAGWSANDGVDAQGIADGSSDDVADVLSPADADADVAPCTMYGGPPACAPPDAGPMPTAACDSTVDAADCPLPPSTCDGNDWLVYYQGGQCLHDACVWERRFYFCDTGCGAGACYTGPTK